MPISFSERVRIAPEVMIRQVGGESVILDLKTEQYLGLDEVGTRMWHLLMDSTSIQAAYDKLLEEYEVTATQLERDLRGLLDKLLENELITVDPATP